MTSRVMAAVTTAAHDAGMDTAATTFIREAMPLCATLGITARVLDRDAVELALPWSAALCTSGGLLHGGALVTLADSAAAAMAYLHLPEGASGTSTIEAKVNFTGALRDGEAVARSALVHAGSSTIVVETEVRDAAGRLLAKGLQTQAVLHRAPVVLAPALS